MNTLIWQRTIAVALLLSGLMAITRFDHLGNTVSLPDASLAVFFLAGFCETALWLFVALLLEAGMIDYLAIAHFGASDFCISAAYLFLIPAYGVLWFAGKYARRYGQLGHSDSLKVFALAIFAVSFSFLISNGSFYLLSGKFGEMSLNAFYVQFANYYPSFVGVSLIYVGIGLVAIKLKHFLFSEVWSESRG